MAGSRVLSLAAGLCIASAVWAQAEKPQLIDTPEKARAAQKECAEKLGKPIQWTNSIGMKFQLIPPAEFIMGSGLEKDEPAHRVVLTRPFYMATTEVTRAQWEKVTELIRSDYFPGPQKAMNFISYDAAATFIAKLNKAEGAKYRMPTEAEWEFAARAGAGTRYYNGDAEADLAKIAWYVENSNSQLQDVGLKDPNGFGLYDMLGNAWEWCSDEYDPQYYASSPVQDPTGPANTMYHYRVLRGGSIYFPANSCRASHRDYYQETRSEKHIGFRIILPVETAAPATAPAPVTPATAK